MNVPRCSLCVFGDATSAAIARMHPSYAFVACHASASVAGVYAAANAAAQKEALPGVSAYCAECWQVSWLARTDDLQEALLDMHCSRENMLGLHAVMLEVAAVPQGAEEE